MAKLSKKQIKNLLETVDAEFFILPAKISLIGAGSERAHGVATTLQASLEIAREQYEKELNDEKIDYKDAGNNFIEACKKAVETSIPILEKDLGWGEYLKNMLKTVVNAVMKVGHSRANFFPLAMTEGSKNAAGIGEGLERDIKDQHQEIEDDNNFIP